MDSAQEKYEPHFSKKLHRLNHQFTLFLALRIYSFPKHEKGRNLSVRTTDIAMHNRKIVDSSSLSIK